jgi:hypothetical protein
MISGAERPAEPKDRILDDSLLELERARTPFWRNPPRAPVAHEDRPVGATVDTRPLRRLDLHARFAAHNGFGDVAMAFEVQTHCAELGTNGRARAVRDGRALGAAATPNRARPVVPARERHKERGREREDRTSTTHLPPTRRSHLS